MSYLFSREAAIEILKKFGDEEVFKEYMKLIEDQPSSNEEKKMKQIPLFSHSNFTGKRTDLADRAKIELSKIIRENFFSPELVETFLDRLNSDHTNVIHYDKKKFDDLRKSFETSFSLVLSPSFLSNFRIGHTYFNYALYSQTLEAISKLGSHLADLIPYCSIPDFLLTLDDVGDYIGVKVKTINHLQPLYSNDDSNIPYYSQLVIETISFNLDPLATNRFSPISLITDPTFGLFLELDSTLSSSNPFSLENFMSIFKAFSSAVSPETGLLSKDGLASIQDNFCFSQSIINRIYETTYLYNGMLDFSGYLRVYIRHKYLSKLPGAKFFFDLIDVDGDGIVGLSDLNYFFKDLVVNSGLDAPNYITLDVFMQELLDKIGVQEKGFTLDQLIETDSTEYVISVLIDYSEFRAYIGQDDN